MSEQQRLASRKGRRLTLRARAQRQEETRRRIIQAAVELHESLGPLATTITAIAGRAGVERLTVYRHFPDERSLHEACTAHFFEQNPPPELGSWKRIEEPAARLRYGLDELYAYWARTAPMMSSVLADHEREPGRAGGGAIAYMAQAKKTLLAGWAIDRRERKRLHAAIGHAVHFYTWRSLVREHGLSSRAAAALMTDLVLSVARSDERLTQQPKARSIDRRGT